jgi:hypothetical protein
MDKPQAKSNDTFMSRLIAIAESDRSENERIDQAVALCTAYVADVKARHQIATRKQVNPQERAIIESDVAAIRNTIAHREALLPNHSEVRRVLRVARVAIEMDSRASNAMGEILKDELTTDHGGVNSQTSQ